MAEVWTDTPVVALYIDAYNVSQGGDKLEVVYKENLARELEQARRKPALAIGRYLKDPGLRSIFQQTDYLFNEFVLSKNAFYPGLLKFEGENVQQTLLPVSFNLPLIVLESATQSSLSDNFVIDPETLKNEGARFNVASKQGTFTKMGFSPRWYPDLLYYAARLHSANFRFKGALSWNGAGIAEAARYVKEWSGTTNGSAAAEDDFQFKYLYLPVYKSVAEERIRFAYLDSRDYFLIPEEKRVTLAFRWFSKDKTIPVADDAVYAGLCRKGKNMQSAESFLKWFFREETQKSLLEDSRMNREMESNFGIAGGFSSIKSVNDKLFPVFYPSLLGHLPPPDYVKSVPAMNSEWPRLKQKVILPFLVAVMGSSRPADMDADLQARITEWKKAGQDN